MTNKILLKINSTGLRNPNLFRNIDMNHVYFMENIDGSKH